MKKRGVSWLCRLFCFERKDDKKRFAVIQPRKIARSRLRDLIEGEGRGSGVIMGAVG